MHKELKKSKAELYQNVDMKIFGPVNVTDFSNENTKGNIYQSKNIETQNHFNLEFKVVIMLIMEVIMIQNTVM